MEGYFFLEGKIVGKSLRHDPKHFEDHQLSPRELAESQCSKKSKKATSNKVSLKQLLHGHFSYQHIWPFRNENKKGHKV